MRRTGLYILALAISSASLAAEVCPPQCLPKTPTCAERIARARKAGCDFPKTETASVPVAVPCLSKPCKAVPCEQPVVPPLDCAALIARYYDTVDALTAHCGRQPEEAPTGHWLVGGGPVWRTRWGATAVAGYQFASGWQIQAGPVYLPDSSHGGYVSVCEADTYAVVSALATGTRPPPCSSVPYHVEQSSPWGAMALAVYRFP